MKLLFLASLAAIWVAYFIGRGHEYREWMAATDDIDWLSQGDTYQAAILRTALREETL